MRPIAVSRPFGTNTFMPAGCLHYPIGEQDMLMEWVDALARARNGFGLLMGDSLDIARSTYRKHIKGYTEDQNSRMALDEYVKADVAGLAKILRPVKSKLIGAILGNHYWEFSDGTNTEQYLCQLLGIPYLGPLAMIRLDFREPDGRLRKHLTLFGHHSGGIKSSRATSSDINSMEKQRAGFDADIVCVSHTHRKHGVKHSLIRLASKGHPAVLERPVVLIRSGAFLKGFKEEGVLPTEMPHYPSYAEDAAYAPTELGWVTLKIDMTNQGGKKKSGPMRDQHVKVKFTLEF